MLYELKHKESDSIIGVYKTEEAVENAVMDYIEEKDLEEDTFSITIYDCCIQ
jgi:hypothetical protein